MASSYHIGLIDNSRNRYRMWAYQNSMIVVLAKCLTFFKQRKIITFSHWNSPNINNNFKDNIMRKKVNNIPSKAKTSNICTLEPNWNWIHN